MNIAIILEAAGNSTRYGSNKLLHIMEDGKPMICRILNAAGEHCAGTGDISLDAAGY